MTFGGSASRALVAVAPGVGAVPGGVATALLAAPSCGFDVSELQELYPDASAWLRMVVLAGAIFWCIWIVAFFRAPKWRDAVGLRSIEGRLTAVSSTLVGASIGIVFSLLAFAVVGGVEDMCERVLAPIVLIWLLIFLVPLFLLYLAVEVMLDLRRRRRARSFPL